MHLFSNPTTTILLPPYWLPNKRASNVGFLLSTEANVRLGLLQPCGTAKDEAGAGYFHFIEKSRDPVAPFGAKKVVRKSASPARSS
jgi:hypothetical protein